MKNIICLFSLIISMLFCTLNAEEKRVLIIGNSYTFCNDLPAVLQALSSKTKCPLIVESYTAGAMSLRGFLDDPQHAKAKQLVESGNYDWVILQDQSQTPAYKPDETMDSVRRWTAIANKSNTKVMLFLTWAHASSDGGKTSPLIAMQEQTSTTYCKAAVANKVKVAPVGEAWARWYRKHPGKALHTDDMSHPNPNGTYLAACVIHASISGKPIKAGGTLKIGKKVVIRIPKGTAKELQSVANATVKGFSPQKYLDEQAEQDASRPTAAAVKAKLRKGMTLDELKEITGNPIHKSNSAGRKTYMFRIQQGAELVAYCNSDDVIENISIAAPDKPVEIIDVTKL